MSFFFLALSLLIFGAVSLLSFPAFAIFGTTFLFYINAPAFLADNYGFSNLTELAVVCMGVIFLRDIWKDRELPAMLTPCSIVFSLYVGSLLLGLFVAKDASILISGTTQVARDAIVALALVAVVRTRARFIAALMGIALAASLLAWLSLTDWFTGVDLSDRLGFDLSRQRQIAGDVTAARYQGTVGDPNYYARILVVALPLLIPIIVTAKSLLPRLVLGANLVGVLSTAILLTASRGALVAIAITGFFAAFRHRGHFYLSMYLALIPGLLLYIFLPDAFTDRISIAAMDVVRIVQSSGNIADKAVSGRVSEMAVGIVHFSENPLMGIGYGQFESQYQDTARLHGLMARGADRQAHSLYFEILAERGIVGAVWFALLMTFSILSVNYTRRAALVVGDRLIAQLASALFFSVVAFLTTALFLHDAFPRYLWTLIALACAAPQSLKTHQPIPALDIRKALIA